MEKRGQFHHAKRTLRPNPFPTTPYRHIPLHSRAITRGIHSYYVNSPLSGCEDGNRGLGTFICIIQGERYPDNEGRTSFSHIPKLTLYIKEDLLGLYTAAMKNSIRLFFPPSISGGRWKCSINSFSGEEREEGIATDAVDVVLTSDHTSVPLTISWQTA